MKLPLSLIQHFLFLPFSAQEIGETLTLLGLEVDGIENPLPSFAQVVVGEILSVQKHPSADKLQVAQVSDGKETYTVVCGAPNCRQGIKTAFARVGALLTDQDGLQRRIEKSSIRGVDSFGMLSSASELGLSNDHDGILELPLDLENGKDLSSFLWDPVFDISLTPNLGHCMSALGVARELSAALQTPLKKESLPLPSLPSFPAEVKSHLCSRYSCLLIEKIQLKETSFWIKWQLQAMNQKCIHPIVDVTNYLQLQRGTPLHAFDADLIEGKIIVGQAESPFLFLGLDGVERTVPKGTLLISDEKKPLAIAGVIGGANSAVSEKTTRVLLESAHFDSASIRKTSKAIGLRTESSQRFEKGVDSQELIFSLSAALQMLKAKPLSFSDVQKKPFVPRKIFYRPERINQILGTHLSQTEIEEILAREGIQTQKEHALIPSYRNDLSLEIDLVEEVARIYGYNHIEKKEPLCSISKIPSDPLFLFEKWAKKQLVKSSLTEFLCCDLISPALAESVQKAHIPPSSFLVSSYSKSEEFSVLRTSLLPGLLTSVQRNFAQKNPNLAAFEVGRIHFLEKGKVTEIPMIGILLSGEKRKSHWNQKAESFDFFDLKAIVETLVEPIYLHSEHASFHPGRQANILLSEHVLGVLGQLHPHLLAKFDIEKPVFYAEINLLDLMHMHKKEIKMKPLAQFPSSERDITLPLERKSAIGSTFEKIDSFQSTLLEKVELIDLYFPENQNIKHATFRFTYRDPLKTVSFDEVESEHLKITKLLAK